MAVVFSQGRINLLALNFATKFVPKRPLEHIILFCCYQIVLLLLLLLLLLIFLVALVVVVGVVVVVALLFWRSEDKHRTEAGKPSALITGPRPVRLDPIGYELNQVLTLNQKSVSGSGGLRIQILCVNTVAVDGGN